MFKTTPQLRRLGIAVRTVRTARGLSADRAAAAARISPVTWLSVEAGRSVREMTYGAVERALQLAPGVLRTALAALDGDDSLSSTEVAAGLLDADTDTDAEGCRSCGHGPVLAQVRRVVADERFSAATRLLMVADLLAAGED